jgi:hypothetical protein
LQTCLGVARRWTLRRARRLACEPLRPALRVPGARERDRPHSVQARAEQPRWS